MYIKPKTILRITLLTLFMSMQRGFGSPRDLKPF